MAIIAERQESPRRISLAAVIGRARLFSGLVLFVYVLTHLLNHAIGVWSIPAMDRVQGLLLAVWVHPVGTVLLYGSVLVHVSIALRAVWTRDSFRAMSGWEIAQLALGLTIPLLLVDHALGTRYAFEAHGANADYTYVLLTLWVFSPLLAVKQAVALLVAWVHGCIGLALWLRFKPWFDGARPWLLAAAVAVPTMSLAGFVAAGMEVRSLARDADWLQRAVTAMRQPPAEDIEATGRLTDRARVGFILLIAGAFTARQIRILVERKTRGVTLRYGSGRSVRATSGMTVLAVSRTHGIPHASVCGGRGRCSTCRIRVGRGLDALPEPTDVEAKILKRIAAPPNVRLACQTHAVDGLEVVPLLPPHTAEAADGHGGPSYLQGRELEIAVLFADLRGFTRISEQRLPYDVVFILNRYFAEMGAAIEGAGGRLDKFIGDGIMALFGIDSDPRTGARQALAAARAMSARLTELNASLEGELVEPLRIGIGVHLGLAIVGEMGYGRVRGVTAVGDTVNTASRLEGISKEHDAQLIVSQRLVEAAGADLDPAPTLEIDIRGREQTLAIRLVADALGLTT